MNKSTGSKLLKIKPWLTLPEATKYLSTVFGEEVTEADILRSVLDGRLKMSIYFRSTVYAMKGCLKINKIENILEKEPPPNEVLKLIEQISKKIRKFTFVENEDSKVFPIHDDIFNLPMIGSERRHIQEIWQSLVEGPNENHLNLEEVLLEDPDGNIYALKEFFNEDDHFIPPPALNNDENIMEYSNAWFEQHLPQRNNNNYYPAIHLPPDSVFVVRIEALREFERFINDDNVKEINDDYTTVSGVNHQAHPNGHEERHAKKREQVLGAALSVITQWPNQCQSKSGKVEATKIAQLIDDKGKLFWPETGQPPLGREKIEREISKWINKIGK